MEAIKERRPGESPIGSPLVSLKEADEMRIFPWGIVRSYELARKGQLPVPLVRVGNRIYIHRVDVDAYLKKRPFLGEVDQSDVRE